MGKTWILVGALALISACATVQPVKFVGPNGKPAYSMQCSGMGRTLDQCYQAAGEVCPNGYNIVNTPSGTVAVPTAMGVVAGPSHAMAVECK